MKALLYKDLWVNRRFSLSIALVLVIICIIPPPTVSVFVKSANILVLLSCFVPISAALDYPWNNLSIMLPYSSRAFVGSKYILSIFFNALLGIAFFFGQLVTFSDYPPGTAVERLENTLLLISLVLICHALFFPISIRPGRYLSTLEGIYLVASIVLCFLGSNFLFSNNTLHFFFIQHLPVVMILVLLLYLVSYLVSVNRYEKRLW